MPAISAPAPRIHFPLCRQGHLSKIHTWLLSFPASTLTVVSLCNQNETPAHSRGLKWSAVCCCLSSRPSSASCILPHWSFCPLNWYLPQGLWTPCRLTCTASSFSLLRLPLKCHPPLYGSPVWPPFPQAPSHYTRLLRHCYIIDIFTSSSKSTLLIFVCLFLYLVCLSTHPLS